MSSIDEHRVQGNWKEIKQELTQLWADLSEWELEDSKGNMHRISDIIQDKYGESKEEVERKISRFLTKYTPH